VKPVEGGVGKSGSGPKTPTLTPKNNHQGKKGEKPPPKGSSVVSKPQAKPKQPPPKNGNGKKGNKKGQRHQTYDLLVTIDLVR